MDEMYCSVLNVIVFAIIVVVVLEYYGVSVLMYV